jgi:hypothetical protein
MKKTTLILIAVAGMCATMFSSCKKSVPQSTITYVNDTHTPISISVNGASKTIAVRSTASYIANAGTEADVTASTSGSYGATITWSFTDNFPVNGGDNVSEPLDVDASYFYLEVINAYTAATSAIIVNLGLTSQTNEAMTIPNNGIAYGIGYYPAFSNTVIKATYTDNSTKTISSIAIPYTLNASYTANLF